MRSAAATPQPQVSGTIAEAGLQGHAVASPLPDGENASATPHLQRFVGMGPLFASRFCVAIGALVLLGWTFDIEVLKRVMPGFVAMNPATALLFALSGISLAIVVLHASDRRRGVVASGFATTVALVGFAELLDSAGIWHCRVDEFLFTSKTLEMVGGLPNRMATNTAFNFLLVGLSLLLVRRLKRHVLAQALAVVVSFSALLAITGYAYGVTSFSAVGDFIPMALHTAATFLILAVGLFFAVPDAALSEVFAADGSRGLLARRLFPLVVVITLLLGWLAVWGTRHDWFDPALGIALYATTLCVLLAGVVRWTVSSVRKLEAERAAAYAQVAALSRRKDEMIAVVSHDLSSPLTGFRMVIDLLREKNEPTEDLLNLMDHSARRMVAMVRGLLDVTKLQAEETTLERSELLVSDIIRQSIEPLTINANAKHITLRLEVAPDEPELHADPLRIAQIFNNLLSNAVKFTSPGGSVTVTVEPEGDGVTVAVRDTGLGIPKSELAHVFDKFYQASTKATAGESGAGLGLAIVREAVRLHGGRIEVASEVDRGTTFVVHLPRSAPAASNQDG